MKENLHNDKLEDFLRKSLDGHSEDPPSDLWSKIAANLEAPVADLPSAVPKQLAPRLRVLRQWWSVAAAAAVFTGLLIGQHFYLNGKIDSLNKALEQNATQLKELEQKRLTEQPQNEALKINESIENQAATQTVTNAETELQNNHQSSVARTGAPQLQKAANTSSNLLKEVKKQIDGTEASMPPTTSIASQGDNTTEQKASNLAKNEEEEELSQNIDNQSIKSIDSVNTPTEERIASNTAANVERQADMPRTWERKLLPIETPAGISPKVGYIIPAMKQENRFTVGLQAMPMITKAEVKKVREEMDPGGPGPGGPGHFDEHKSFTAKDTVSYKSWMTGVALETQITPRLRLGTGLSYRTTNNESTHEICLDFRDRKHGGNQHEYDFEYNLNTAAGSVEMTLRAESDYQASSIPDTEKVEAIIKTSEHLAYASVPIYANYSFGKGRLRLLAKAGLAFNILLDKDFNIKDIDSQNDKFRFDRQKPQHGSPADLQSLTASYMAGIGLEYQLNKSLSLRAEPTVMGSLSSLHNNPFIESSEISAGLNLGVMYSF